MKLEKIKQIINDNWDKIKVAELSINSVIYPLLYSDQFLHEINRLEEVQKVWRIELATNDWPLSNGSQYIEQEIKLVKFKQFKVFAEFPTVHKYTKASDKAIKEFGTNH